jgi:rhodanese-related sulfurtransferase
MIKKGVKQLIAEAEKRSVLAAAALADMGMTNVLHLEGGFGEWRKAGAPTGPRPEKKKA